MFYSTRSRGAGFTLMELLVVMAIVGILSVIVIGLLTSSREKSRNTAKNAQIEEYQKAIELVRTTNGVYPSGSTNWQCLGNYSDGDCWTGGYSNSSQFLNEVGAFISGTPPLTTAGTYEGALYSCKNTECTEYQLLWFLEGENRDCGPGDFHVNNGSYSGLTYCQYNL